MMNSVPLHSFKLHLSTTMPSPMPTFPQRGREKQSIASQLEGALLISRNSFPYFMLIAFEAGSPIRALLLLLITPLLCFLKLFGLEDMALRSMILVSTAGLRVADIKAVSKATLPKFFLENLRESAYKLFSRCGGEKYVATCIPRIMVEPFLREYLDVDHVIGTELRILGGNCMGLVASPGLMAGVRELEAMRAAMGDEEEIDVGLADGLRDQPFMLLCREPHLIPPEENPSPLPRNGYPKPLIFHDGRFVVLPTPLDSLEVLLWLPLGILLAISRILVGVLFPYKLGPMGTAATGVRIRAQLSRSHHRHTIPETVPSIRRGTLYVCSHRTLLDPVFVSTALQRRVSAVTYSLSRFSEVISPIPTVRLTRDRSKDDGTMRLLLDRGDLVVCPEGTTCREPYLLRFSPLFAEITDDIIPIAVTAEGSMFYGTSVRGYKWLDSFFFLMNPSPWYRMVFLDRPSREWSSSYEAANHIQRLIGRVLGFECTNLTRKDKYRMLAGNDGVC